MGKPEDIPQDVWDRAMGAVQRGEPSGRTIGEAVARALLAERERCVSVILARAEVAGQYDDTVEAIRRG